jgi:small GTP-binding protein
MAEFKVLICGDGFIGKTCLLDTLSERFSVQWDNPEYIPTAACNTRLVWDIEGAGESEIELWDTAGQEALEQLRMMSYPDTQVLLVAFDMCNSVTLENAADYWIPEFRSSCADCPCIILVGTKCDMHGDEIFRENSCSLDDGSIMETALKIGAHGVVLTSAKTEEGVLRTGLRKGFADPSYFNLPDDHHDGIYLIELIQDMCAKIYAGDKIPLVKDVEATHSRTMPVALSPQIAALAAAAPAPAPAQPQKPARRRSEPSHPKERRDEGFEKVEIVQEEDRGMFSSALSWVSQAAGGAAKVAAQKAAALDQQYNISGQAQDAAQAAAQRAAAIDEKYDISGKVGAVKDQATEALEAALESDLVRVAREKANDFATDYLTSKEEERDARTTMTTQAPPPKSSVYKSSDDEQL